MRTSITILVTFFLSVVSFASHAGRMYEVTVTNITKGQTFTPIISATHKPSIQFFELGAVASEPMALIAEAGDISAMQAVLEGSSLVTDIQSTGDLLTPGNTVSWEISATAGTRFSFAAMLIPTNDTFVGLNTVMLPRVGAKTYYAKAYDSGSELNDEECDNIPGPACGGEGFSPDDGEGHIHISSGIHGIQDLASSVYDWRDAVAKIEIRRIK